jgi:hypothetical protein
MTMSALVDPAAAAGATSVGDSWSGWIIGVACGLALAVAFDFDWRSVPDKLRRLAEAVRSQSGWAALGLGSLGVILLY